MKHSFTAYLSIILYVVLLSCTNSNKMGIHKQNAIDSVLCENFDSFTKRFYTDTVFQMSRIEFPLKGLHNELVETTMSNPIGDTILYVWEKKDWTFNNISFVKIVNSTDTTLKDKYGTKYIRKIKKSSTEVIDSVYIEDSGFITVRKFNLKNKIWYLTYYEFYNN
jgi:hypothetical protein